MQCGDDESYALVFSDKGLVRAQLEVFDANTKECIQTLDTPFPSGEIGRINSVQSFDVMFFAHPSTRPCKLTRKDKEGGGYEFSFEDNEFSPEPVLEWNTDSEHDINVFALPDEDLIQVKDDGSYYYPEGVVREAPTAEDITISYSYWTPTYNDPLKDDTVNIFGFAKTTNASKYQVGKTYVLPETISVYVKATYSGHTLGFTGATEVDGAPAPVDNSTLTVRFKYARVERLGTDGVYFYLGSVDFDTSYNYEMESIYGQNSVLVEKAEFGETVFYVALIDAPETEELTNEVYYKPISGNGFEIAFTIDGSNTNENISVGQIIALKYKTSLSETEMWDYESLPVGTTHTTIPPVDVLDTLPSKTASTGEELRPMTGGGYGDASEFFPVRGKVELKTEGVWSGIIELQKMDGESNLSTIARIVSENGLSNTSLERDIDEFGCSVRVACVRREKAYEIQKSVNNDGGVYTHTLCCDEGCQWTLTSADEQSAYLRVKEKRTLTSGLKCYIAEVIGGVGGSFATTSYALGAWSEKNGYPEHIAIYQERLVYAGNKSKPVTLWMSKTNVWDDFELGPDASSSITATLATEKYDKIQWILPNKNGIFVGTQYSEFSIGGSDGAVATADNITATVTSGIGSSGVSADTFGVATIMVKTGGKELHRIDYNTLSEESAGTQVSLLASHLFENDPVVDMFSIKAPSNMLFCLHESGKLSSLTYEPEYSVTGWAQHHVLGGIDSGCVLRNKGKDVLCLVVNSGGRYVLGELDLSSDVWVDDGEAYESSVITTPLKTTTGATTGGSYGKQQVIAGCDIYVGIGTKQFNVRLQGGDWIRIDNGLNELNVLRDFEAQRVEIPATSAWADEATVEIKSSTPYPLVIHAIGASVRA